MADNLTQSAIAGGASTATKQLPDGAHAGKNYPVDSQGNYVDLSSAGIHFPITPDDINPLSTTTRQIYVGGGGDVRAKVGGVNVTYKNVPQGVFMVMKATHILLTGTTATNLVGMA